MAKIQAELLKLTEQIARINETPLDILCENVDSESPSPDTTSSTEA
ncbi:hypothetical protein [Rhizobium sp. BK251]|nr:hypothetical protein [Rhizobium sp. BK251]